MLEYSYAKETGMPLLMLVMFLTTFSFATVTLGKGNCPVQFEGRVEDFIEGVGTSSAFSTHTVIFKNLVTLKGNVKDQVAIEMLEHGPFELERGEDYRIHLRGGHVCWVEKI
jgi:hypothetical protein